MAEKLSAEARQRAMRLSPLQGVICVAASLVVGLGVAFGAILLAVACHVGDGAYVLGILAAWPCIGVLYVTTTFCEGWNLTETEKASKS